MGEELVRFTLGEGSAGVYVEVPGGDPEIVRARRRDGRPPGVAAGFEAGLDQVRDVAARTLERIVALPRSPSSVELEFGVNFSVEAGAVIARTGAVGHMKVKVVWERRAGLATEPEGGDGPGEESWGAGGSGENGSCAGEPGRPGGHAQDGPGDDCHGTPAKTPPA